MLPLCVHLYSSSTRGCRYASERFVELLLGLNRLVYLPVLNADTNSRIRVHRTHTANSHVRNPCKLHIWENSYRVSPQSLYHAFAVQAPLQGFCSFHSPLPLS